VLDHGARIAARFAKSRLPKTSCGNSASKTRLAGAGPRQDGRRGSPNSSPSTGKVVELQVAAVPQSHLTLVPGPHPSPLPKGEGTI
jgi:hypothetical protein